MAPAAEKCPAGHREQVSAPPPPHHVAEKPIDVTVASVTNWTNTVSVVEMITSGIWSPVKLASFGANLSGPSWTLT